MGENGGNCGETRQRKRPSLFNVETWAGCPFQGLSRTMAKEFNEARRFPQIAAGKRPAQRRRGPKKERACETDAHRLAQREKQIMYGEATPGYTHLMKVRPALPSPPPAFRPLPPRPPPPPPRRLRGYR